MSQQLELLTENPSQWSAVTYVTPDIHKKEIKPFVVLALKELEGTPDSRTSSLQNADKYSAVRAVVRHLARNRSGAGDRWSPEDVRVFLETLRFSPECTDELASLLCTEEIYLNLPSHLQVKPALARLTWKIDISLGQSMLQQETPTADRRKEILRSHTHVVLTLALTDGCSRTYRLSVTKFHELRFVIASALKHMIVLEKRKCMRKD